jgi:hypothetical protein
MQSVAEASWNLEDALVSGNHQHFARAVVDRSATMATAQMLLDLPTHFQRGVSIEVSGEIRDYRFAANHGFIPFQRSQIECLGFAKIGDSDSRIISRARCKRIFTADSLIPST